MEVLLVLGPSPATANLQRCPPCPPHTAPSCTPYNITPPTSYTDTSALDTLGHSRFTSCGCDFRVAKRYQFVCLFWQLQALHCITCCTIYQLPTSRAALQLSVIRYHLMECKTQISDLVNSNLFSLQHFHRVYKTDMTVSSL